MLVRCNYEEVSALKHGARAYLEGHDGDEGVVAGPSVDHASVTALVPRLVGDLTLTTLEDLRSVQTAVEAIVVLLRVEMETTVAATHPADEQAVASYFDFAHAFAVQARLAEMGNEMEVLIELMTGQPATDDQAREFVFPD